jgi:hypothetical protein
MFFTLGGNECYATVAMQSGLDEEAPVAMLKEAYLSWLRKHFAPVVVGLGQAEPDFVEDAATEAALLEGFITPAVNPKEQPITLDLIAEITSRRDAKATHEKIARIGAAYSELKSRNIELSDVLSLVVNRIFVSELSTDVSGSSPKHPGVIFVNPPVNATSWDLIESLLHEFVHHVLYLDQSVHGHYLARPDSVLVKSVIKKHERPVRAAFHSLFVALEILQLRRSVHGKHPPVLVHPDDDSLMLASKQTIDSIIALPDWQSLFTSRGLFLFDACRDVWERLVVTDPTNPFPIIDAC